MKKIAAILNLQLREHFVKEISFAQMIKSSTWTRRSVEVTQTRSIIVYLLDCREQCRLSGEWG
jgi:hypothetical protein